MKLVSAKFKAHLHNDLVSEDSLTVGCYLEAQSVHFAQKNLTGVTIKRLFFTIFFLGCMPPSPP